MSVTVECQKRAEGTKPNALRRAGLIPAVLYGHNGTESIALTVNAKTAETLLKKTKVNSTLIDVNIPELSWNGKTLLREVQSHPWKRFPYHLSFFAVGSQGSIEVEVSLHFVGEAIGVKQEGGILDPMLTQLQLRCAPDDIPTAIEVDVSGLHAGDNLHVNQINLPPGVVAINEPETVVVSVVTVRGGSDEKAEA